MGMQPTRLPLQKTEERRGGPPNASEIFAKELVNSAKLAFIGRRECG